MKTLLTILLLTNIAQATDLKTPETDAMLNESLALVDHFKSFNKSIQGIEFFTVGADVACSYSTIQSAIDDYFQSPFANIEIRIATNKTYFENIVIGNANISLTGGYSNCTNANNGIVSSGQSLINANFNGTVLKIQGASVRRTMVFKNLRLINGSNATGAGGGLLSDNSNVSLLLENVDIRNNTARNGAGIAIVGGDTDLLMNESLIFSNVADYGGGIFCSGGLSSVNLSQQSGIIGNSATGSATAPSGRGGGAYIDGCYFAIFTGSANNFSFTGMEANSSMSVGGAIYASSAIIRLHGHEFCGSLGCLGDNINPVSFRNNQSNMLSGSVLYAENSEVRVNATWMEGNVGASVINLSNSGFRFERFLQPCWSNSHCNLVENNFGKVISAGGFNDINISNTTFKNNPDGVMNIVGDLFNRMVLNIESNVFLNNGSFSSSGFIGAPQTVFNFRYAVNVSLIHNTIVDNHSADSIFHLDWNPGIAGTVPPIFEAHSNIVDNPGVLFLTHSFSSAFDGITDIDVNISALITNEIDSISESNDVFNDAINFAGGDFITQTIPGEVLFVDRANGDLHLSPNSRAIDYFNTPSRATVTYKDIDYQDRGIDDPNNQSPISGLFFYDIGADEKIELPDLMFVDGFE